MSADEFWKDDPQLFVSYRTSFINKKEKETEEFDWKCWYQGLYFYKAIRTQIDKLIIFIHSMISKDTDQSKIESYPEKPLKKLQQDEKEKNEKVKQNNEDQNKAFICQASIKQIYIEKLKRQNEGK